MLVIAWPRWKVLSVYVRCATGSPEKGRKGMALAETQLVQLTPPHDGAPFPGTMFDTSVVPKAASVCQESPRARSLTWNRPGSADLRGPPAMLVKSKPALKTARQRNRFRKAIETAAKKVQGCQPTATDTPVRLHCRGIRRGRGTLPPSSKGLSAVDGQSLHAEPLYAIAMPHRE